MAASITRDQRRFAIDDDSQRCALVLIPFIWSGLEAPAILSDKCLRLTAQYL
jgi:hypothetical protein